MSSRSRPMPGSLALFELEQMDIAPSTSQERLLELASESAGPAVDVNKRAKLVGEAAVAFFKSHGEQTVPFFITLDPENPKTDDELLAEVARTATPQSIKKGAQAIKDKKIAKSKKLLAEAAAMDEYHQYGFTSKAHAQRIEKVMWNSFEQWYYAHFGNCTDEEKLRRKLGKLIFKNN